MPKLRKNNCAGPDSQMREASDQKLNGFRAVASRVVSTTSFKGISGRMVGSQRARPDMPGLGGQSSSRLWLEGLPDLQLHQRTKLCGRQLSLTFPLTGNLLKGSVTRAPQVRL